ncbi:transporter substrate-binding domain-containing protein [Knoellia subterranea]|uniref:ABC transporter substrate-binding protein n=1 Tax=Knoellia subterranea KCTC 19937 TaxID=1385521 RepID=A0A0A0JN49_9MICO|nr:transporter substrate-binding domain-containing protein [Knoellia subterranea]KGN37026.1 ABC transporter substrate-binding protein [Knoellia subterranea KCTC 19937]
MTADDLAPTGVLRASINLGNAVLTNGSFDEPAGISIDIAHELAGRLGVPVELVLWDAARKSVDAVRDGVADVCFLAVDPVRAEALAFTAPYVLIEGAYAVRSDSPLRSACDVDQSGVRVGVKLGSAYDLHLSRALTAAEVVRGSGGVHVFDEQGTEVAAGIRQPIEAYVEAHPGLRVLDGAFMQIPQAVAVSRRLSDATVEWVRTVVVELIDTGWVADALARHGQDPSMAAPPAAQD